MTKKEAAMRFAVITVNTEAHRSFLEDPEYSDSEGDLVQHALETNGYFFNARYVVPTHPAEVKHAVLNTVYEDRSNLVTIVLGGDAITRAKTLSLISELYDYPLSSFASAVSALALRDLGVKESMSSSSAGVIDDSIVLCLSGDEDLLRLVLDEFVVPYSRDLYRGLGLPET